MQLLEGGSEIEGFTPQSCSLTGLTPRIPLKLAPLGDRI